VEVLLDEGTAHHETIHRCDEKSEIGRRLRIHLHRSHQIETRGGDHDDAILLQKLHVTEEGRGSC
jgi:hypothetical protein